MARREPQFQAIRSEGGLLPPDLLRRALDPRSGLSGMKPEDYSLAAGERLNETITQSWNRLRKHWAEFRSAAGHLPEGEAGTGLTNDKWSLPLLRELGFGLLPASAGPEIGGRTYAIRRFFGPVPIHLIGCGLSLDRRAAGQRGAASVNPHGLVQEFLNRSEAHLWAIVSNGLRLRILRDNQALSRQSFLEFDLESIFSGELFSDFVLVWVMTHASRFTPRDGDRPETCRLEEWTREAERQGARALGELRGGVEHALQSLGEGYASHPRNGTLREALRSGELKLDDFHGQLLRVVYRLIFLFVAEDRMLDGQPLLHPRDDSDTARTARERYARYYGTARLRELAGRLKGTRHGDLWRQFRFLVGPLSGDPGSEAARRHLALPAFGSFLWDPASTPDLNDAELTNHDFLESLRRLAFIRQGKVLRPVDYRSLGAEELGGVYESLLALTPQLSGDGTRFSFAEFAGNVRKTSGSYYTPDALVQCLLDSALEPVVEAAVHGRSGADAEQAILDLKVCDPAVGSGHFLVGAAHRLARHLARVRAHAAGESEPSPLLYQHALRDVIGRCLYGVDMNPMAAELCRVSLWLEALEPGKPLSFLDHHIRVGNSLLGTTPELVEAGLPDDAFKPRQGDDRDICTGLRRRNRQERESGQHDMGYLMVAEPSAEYDTLASRSRWIAESPDDTLGEVQRKEAQFRRLVVSEDYRHRQQVADAWCSAFVQPKEAGRDPALCITTDTLRGLEADLDALAPAQRREVERLAREYQFFHWHFAFPEVFERGGFDCVLGNPPWERVKLQEKEWFAKRSPEIADAPNAAARKLMIRVLADDDPELYRAFLDALRKSESWSHLMRSTGRYPLCGRGDINLYAVFSEAMRTLLNDWGRVGCVLPTGIATDDTTKRFFQDVVRTRALASLFDFENKGIFFPDVHRNYKFCLFTTGRGLRPTADRAEFVFFAHAVEALRDPEHRFALSPDDIALINPNTHTCPIFRTGKDAELTKAIYRRVPVLIREARDGQPEENPWGIRFSAMFHMANDSHRFHTRERLEADGWKLVRNAFRKDGAEHLPLYEAKMIHQFDHRWASYRVTGGKTVSADVTLLDKLDPTFAVLPRYWVEAREVHQRIQAKSIAGRIPHPRRTADLPEPLETPSSLQPGQRFRDGDSGGNTRIEASDSTNQASPGWVMGWRDITRSVEKRTTIADIIPIAAVGDQLLLMYPDTTTQLATALLGTLNSFVFDFVARQKLSGIHLKYFTMKQTTVLAPDAYSDADLAFMVPRVLELLYTGEDLRDFAHGCGWDGPPFRWDEERRFLLRCELDAAFFHLYLPVDANGNWRPARRSDGCPGDETPEQLADIRHHFPTPRDAVASILDTFPGVRREDEAKHGEYRTKRVILEIYDEMQRATRTGRPYQTRLVPPPADPGCCHPPHTIAPALPIPIDLAEIADGAWRRAGTDQAGDEAAVLAAILKTAGGPVPIRRVRLAAVLTMVPRLLTPSLPAEEAAHWRRLVGPEAEPLPTGVAWLQPRAEHAWGQVVRHLRGNGYLVEDLDSRTWAPGPGLDAIHTEGWPDGRAGVVLRALQRRGDEEIVQTLPPAVLGWIDDAAA